VTAIDLVSGWTAAAHTRARGSSLFPHLALLLTILLWSANATFVKVGVTHVRPIAFTTARFALGALVLALFAIVSGRRLNQRPPWKLLVMASVFGFILNQLTFTFGLRLSTVVDVSLIVGLAPILAAIVLFATVTRRRLPARRLAGLLLGFAGIVLVVAAGARSGGGSLLGDLVALGTPLSWAVYMVVADQAAKRSDVIVFTTWCVVASALAFLPLAAVEALRGYDDWIPALPSIAYSGIAATGIAYALYAWALPRVGVTETSMYTYVQPVCGVAAGAVFLHEAVGLPQIAGGAAILVAAYLGSWSRARPVPE
jgi:drug/metabolite transporter (DMT)-like permease